jgi:hypothetical protein
MGQAEIANRSASMANWRDNPPNDRRILDVCFDVRLITLFTVITLIVEHSIIEARRASGYES